VLIGGGQVTVVIDEDVLNRSKRGSQIPHRSGKAASQFIQRNVMATLKNSYAHTLLGNGWARNPHEDEDNRVSGTLRTLQKRQFISSRIGENSFENKTSSLV
jgi:hypothetical protein